MASRTSSAYSDGAPARKALNALRTWARSTRYARSNSIPRDVDLMNFDPNNALTQVTDSRNLVTTYQNNGFGEVKTLASPDTALTTNTYDSGGNLQTTADARGAVATYTHDALNCATSVAYQIGGTIDQTIFYSFDTGTNGSGRLTGASDASHTLSWNYDAQGRLTTKSQSVGGIAKSVSYTYTNGDIS